MSTYTYSRPEKPVGVIELGGMEARCEFSPEPGSLTSRLSALNAKGEEGERASELASICPSPGQSAEYWSQEKPFQL